MYYGLPHATMVRTSLLCIYPCTMVYLVQTWYVPQFNRYLLLYYGLPSLNMVRTTVYSRVYYGLPSLNMVRTTVY